MKQDGKVECISDHIRDPGEICSIRWGELCIHNFSGVLQIYHYNYSFGTLGAVALTVGSVPRRIVQELRHFHWLLKMNNRSN